MKHFVRFIAAAALAMICSGIVGITIMAIRDLKKSNEERDKQTEIIFKQMEVTNN